MKENDEVKLLGCPFCGGKARFEPRKLQDGSEYWVAGCFLDADYQAKLTGCGITKSAGTKEWAAEKWNSRATPEGSVVPDGFVLVPLEPTQEMTTAGRNAQTKYNRQCEKIGLTPLGNYTEIYKAMLAASDKERKD